MPTIGRDLKVKSGYPIIVVAKKEPTTENATGENATDLRDQIAMQPINPAPVGSNFPWKSILLSMFVLSGAFAGRGYLLAWLVDGRYTWPVLLLDCISLALIILAFRILDLGVKKLAVRCIGDQTRSRRIVAAIVNWSLVFFLAAPFLIAFVQFHPQKIACGSTPAEVSLPFSEEVLISGDLHLSAWHIPASSPKRPVVVICHGLGANKQNFLYPAYLVHNLDYNALVFDFRGHGDSDGRTISFGVNEAADVKAALDFAQARHPSSKIYGLGYSMGGSALIRMAAEHPGFDKIVLDSTFARADNVALHSMLWYFGPLKRPMFEVGRFWGQMFSGADIGQHNPEEHIGRIKCPIFLIHGAADTMIPASESVRLQSATGNQAKLWLVEGADHLQSMGQPTYQKSLQAFFEDNGVDNK